MPTNERIVLVVVGNITCVHWLALLWDIWMTIWLGDYMVVCHEFYAAAVVRLVVMMFVSGYSLCFGRVLPCGAVCDTERTFFPWITR